MNDQLNLEQNTAPVALIKGKPVREFPKDLYIPPEKLEVFLDAFEGPLDFLLYIIRKQQLDILDLPMTQLTEQYMAYIDQIRLHKLELAAEYLLMAATLTEIKSYMLLPRVEIPGEEEKDPRANLAESILQYERIKLAAQKLDSLPIVGDDFLTSSIFIPKSNEPNWPKIDVEQIYQAFAEVVRKNKLANTKHTVTQQGLSVREHMSLILQKIQDEPFIEFFDLFDPNYSVAVLVVHFLALLELARKALIEFTQVEPFAPIYIRLLAPLDENIS